MYYDKDNIDKKILKKIEGYTKAETFQPEYVHGKSIAAGALCMWVRSIEDYSKALKIVAPKREKKRNAEEQLKLKMEYLATLESTF